MDPGDEEIERGLEDSEGDEGKGNDRRMEGEPVIS